MNVKKAIFPVAGLGTRFLPATKAIPKELIPLVDRPVLDYVVEEAVASGIKHCVFITSRGKEAIENFFDVDAMLEHMLSDRGKEELLKLVSEIPRRQQCSFIRQGVPLGLGHAILTAREIVDGEPFAVLLGDDLIHSTVPTLREMLDIFEARGKSVIALEDVPRHMTALYGVIEGEEVEEGLYRIVRVVEKPKPEDAPSTLTIVGR